MSIFKNIAGMLRAPVGSNLDNNPKDVENTKKHYAAIGRYKRPIENGYIDQELDDAIYGFQKDYNLKVDGRMNPGGETEATLLGEVMKIPKPQKSKQQSGYQTAAAGAVRAVPPLLAVLGAVMGKTAEDTQKWWENGDTTPEEREQAIKSLPNSPNDDEENRKQDCEDEYKNNTDLCNQSGRKHGPDVARVCHETAFSRYSQCLANKPKDDKERVRIQNKRYD